jgi:mRNA-degrading endonuclease HigB of HigAB toxin-antitoxin module
MKLFRKNILERLKDKNKGNVKLIRAIDELISTIEMKAWKTKEDIKADRPDADQVHSNGFYFFNINIHRTLVLIEIADHDGVAKVIWAGSHDKYERFKKDT